MKPQSAKAKGRNFQKWVRDMLIEHRDVHPEDIESRSMGAGGEDLICLLYTSPSPRDATLSRMPSSA